MFAWIGGEIEHAELVAAFDRLDSLESWIDDYDGTRAAQGKLKNLTSQLIGRFVGAATQATLGRQEGERLGRFGADILVPRVRTAQQARHP